MQYDAGHDECIFVKVRVCTPTWLSLSTPQTPASIHQQSLAVPRSSGPCSFLTSNQQDYGVENNGHGKTNGGEYSSNYWKRPRDTYFVCPISALPTVDLNDPVLSRESSTQAQTQKKLMPSLRTTRDRRSVYACSNMIIINGQTRLSWSISVTPVIQAYIAGVTNGH